MLRKDLVEKCDALIIGSGAAGLLSAMTIKDLRPEWKVWVAEQSESIGGTTVYSGGVCWLPGNHGKKDPDRDLEEARKYLRNAYPMIDEVGLESYLSDSPRVLEYMISKGIAMQTWPEYPDYYQEIEGASTGRSVFPDVYVGPKKIRSVIRKVPYFYPPFTIKEAKDWGEHRLLHWNKTLMAKRKMLGHMVMGQGYIGYMLETCLNEGVDVSMGCKTEHLLIENGAIEGAIVNGKKVPAPVVIMACGGFSHNPELMKHISAVRKVYSVASEECDNGGGMALALDAGLKVGNPHCWWIPIFKIYDDRKEDKPGPDLWAYHPTLHDRAWPGGIMVNGEGKRFMNEAAAYNTTGGHLAQEKDPNLNNVWLIWGQYYVKNYIRGNVSWLNPAKSWMNKSKSIRELAMKTGLPEDNLRQTLKHWNEMAAREKDDDFHRGENIYDQFMGDHFRQGHPNIGPLEAPFQAVRVYPGCLATKMGPVTDEFGRVRLQDDRVVNGLYAVGNAAGSLFGNIYPGAGGTLGPAAVFGFRAAHHAAKGGR